MTSFFYRLYVTLKGFQVKVIYQHFNEFTEVNTSIEPGLMTGIVLHNLGNV